MFSLGKLVKYDVFSNESFWSSFKLFSSSNEINKLSLLYLQEHKDILLSMSFSELNIPLLVDDIHHIFKQLYYDVFVDGKLKQVPNKEFFKVIFLVYIR